MAVSKKRKKNGKPAQFNKVKFFYKKFNNVETITDRILYYNKFIGANKEPHEYELRNYLSTLLYFCKRNDKKYEEFLHGETRIGLQQYLNKDVLIYGKLVNVKTDENGYVTKVCLSGPYLYGIIKNLEKLKEGLSKIDPNNRLNNTENLNYLVDFLDNYYKFGSHIWVNIDNKAKLTDLYLGTEVQFISKVISYKGKVKKEGYRTLKYGLDKGYFVCQSIVTTLKNPEIQSRNKSKKENRDGTISLTISETNRIIRYECGEWHKEMAVCSLEDNKLKLNEEVYNFFATVKTDENAVERFAELISKYDIKYLNSLKNKMSILKSVGKFNLEVRKREDENNSKTKMED